MCLLLKFMYPYETHVLLSKTLSSFLSNLFPLICETLSTMHQMIQTLAVFISILSFLYKHKYQNPNQPTTCTRLPSNLATSYLHLHSSKITKSLDCLHIASFSMPYQPHNPSLPIASSFKALK